MNALRLAKRGIAALLLVISLVAFLANSVYVTSDNAVVTAHVVSMRAPIEGFVQSRTGAVGDRVMPGTHLADIVNPLVDGRLAADLQIKANRLQADLDAMRREQTLLQSFQADLADRVTKHREAKSRQLALEMDRMDRERAAKVGELQQLIRTMKRKQALAGTISAAEVEQAATAVQVAMQQAASLERQLSEAQWAHEAAIKGVLVEANGGNDVAYSEQRADEVRVRLLELERAIESTSAEAEETQERLAAEERETARHRNASIVAPMEGMIWRLGSGPNERVRAGDVVVQMVDCSSAFLAVDVPQNRVADIDVSAPAAFRLSGEREDRTGRVEVITGETVVSGDRGLAVLPTSATRPMASVIVAVPPSPNQGNACLVGRTARVMLKATTAGRFAWIWRYLPL